MENVNEIKRQDGCESDETNKTAPGIPVPLLDIARENGPLTEEFAAAMASVVTSGKFVLGPKCVELEEALAKRTGSQFGVGCASGSDALLLCMMAMDIQAGDEVLLPSFTFFATASAVRRLGATPVFVDIEADSFNIDPVDLQRKITPRTRAIIPVHLFGRSANMTRLVEIAAAHDLKIIEDCAQSIDSAHAGQLTGSMGLAGCFSFYPTKNLGGFGDAGMVTTSDPEFAERLRVLRGHGMKPRYYHAELGINSRLDSLQAAVLLVKLPHLANWTQKRQRNAERYPDLFEQSFAAEGAGSLLGEAIQLPSHDTHGVTVWNQYTLRIKNGQRDALRQNLSEQKIGSEIYYPAPLHLQTCFADLGWKAGSLPVTEKAAEEVLSIPVFPELTLAEQETTTRSIARYLKRQSHRRVA